MPIVLSFDKFSRLIEEFCCSTAAASLVGVDSLVGDILGFVVVGIGYMHPDKCHSSVLEVLGGSSGSCMRLSGRKRKFDSIACN